MHRGGEYRSDLQALRGLAVLVVVIYHARVLLPGGFVGVDVFFVISGFVIGSRLVRELTADQPGIIRRFALRRARRLLPALALMLTVVGLLAPAIAPIGATELTRRTGIAAALFHANHYLQGAAERGYLDVETRLNPLLHTWSLSVEEQFYFVIPAVLVACWLVGLRAGDPRRALRGLVVALTAFSFGISLWYVAHAEDLGAQRVAFFSPVTRAWEFGVGLALAVFPIARGASRRVGLVSTATGVALVLIASRWFDEDTVFPGAAALVPVLGAAMAIVGGGLVSERRAELMTRRPMWLLESLGDVSYSWYLWHWPMIVVAGALWPESGRLPLVVAAAVSLIPAIVSHRFVELPFRTAPNPATGATLALVGVCIVVPISAAFAASATGAVVSNEPAVQSFRSAQEPHLRNGTCDDLPPTSELDLEQCTWGPRGTSTSVVLVGDSNAGQFIEPLVDAVAAIDADLLVSTRSACPFADLIAEAPIPAPGCQDYVGQATRYLEENPPDIVIVVNATDRYVFWEGSRIVDPSNGIRAADQQENGDLFEAGLRRTIARLESAGIEVIVANVVPKPWAAGRATDSRSCASLLIAIAPDRCVGAPFGADAPVTVAAQTIERRSARQAGASTWDVTEDLCPGGRCHIWNGTTLTWAEPLHITPAASAELADSAERMLLDARARHAEKAE